MRIKTTWPLYLLPVGLFLGFFFFYPVIRGIAASFRPEGVVGWSLANYRRFFSDPRMLRILRFTALDLGVVATSLSILIAVPIAYRLRRYFRGVTIFRTLVTLPLAYSGVIAVSLVYFAFTGAGLLSLTLRRIGIIEHPLHLMGGYTGVIIASIYQQVPFVFLFILAAMAGVNPTLEEAAKTLGASKWQVFRRVILPLTLPAIMMAAILGYITNYGAFVTAIIPGDPAFATRTVLIEAWHQAFRRWDWSMSVTITTIAGAVAMVFVYIFLLLQRKVMRGLGAQG